MYNEDKMILMMYIIKKVLNRNRRIHYAVESSEKHSVRSDIWAFAVVEWVDRSVDDVDGRE